MALRKNLPFAVVATGVVLSGTQASITANPISIAGVKNFATIALSISYTRNAGSATGKPIIALKVSRDPFETAVASVANLQPLVYLTDAATFVAGAITAYPALFTVFPSAAGTTVFGFPEEPDVTSWNWLQILMSDVDAAFPGTVTVYLGGTAVT